MLHWPGLPCGIPGLRGEAAPKMSTPAAEAIVFANAGFPHLGIPSRSRGSLFTRVFELHRTVGGAGKSDIN